MQNAIRVLGLITRFLRFYFLVIISLRISVNYRHTVRVINRIRRIGVKKRVLCRFLGVSSSGSLGVSSFTKSM